MRCALLAQCTALPMILYYHVRLNDFHQSNRSSHGVVWSVQTRSETAALKGANRFSDEGKQIRTL